MKCGVSIKIEKESEKKDKKSVVKKRENENWFNRKNKVMAQRKKDRTEKGCLINKNER